MAYEQVRRRLTTEEEEKVRFWVDALLQGSNPERAAHELFAIGVRTRGAVRTRGSASRPASSRLPSDVDTDRIFNIFQRDIPPTLRSAVASALGEMGGEEAIPVLKRLAVSSEDSERYPDAGVRAAALDAIGIIGGREALAALETAAASDPAPTVQSIAVSLIMSLGESDSSPAIEALRRLEQSLPEGVVRERVVAALNTLSHHG